MPSKSPSEKLVYWDSDVILNYLDPNTDPSIILTLETLLDCSDNKSLPFRIITSTLTIAEVAFSAKEKLDFKEDPADWAAIQRIWNDGAVHLVEFYRQIAEEARGIVRDSRFKQYALKPKDSIHAATAKLLEVDEMHTFDKDLLACSGKFGFTIAHPNLLLAPRALRTIGGPPPPGESTAATAGE